MMFLCAFFVPPKTIFNDNLPMVEVPQCLQLRNSLSELHLVIAAVISLFSAITFQFVDASTFCLV